MAASTNAKHARVFAEIFADRESGIIGWLE